MTLEEAVELLAKGKRAAVNSVGTNDLVVKLLAEEKTENYGCYVADMKKLGPNGSHIGEYRTVEEVKKHFAGLSIAPDINPNGWVVE